MWYIMLFYFFCETSLHSDINDFRRTCNEAPTKNMIIETCKEVFFIDIVDNGLRKRN